MLNLIFCFKTIVEDVIAPGADSSDCHETIPGEFI